MAIEVEEESKLTFFSVPTIAAVTKVCGADLLDASMEYKQQIDARGSHVTAALRVSLALYGVFREVVCIECGEAIATKYMSSTHLQVNRTAHQAHESYSCPRIARAIPRLVLRASYVLLIL